MTRELSAFEQNLVNAMTEHAHDVDPPRFDAPLIVAGERRRARRRTGLAAASLATAAGIAACVAASPTGSGRTTPPAVSATRTGTIPSPASTSPSSSAAPTSPTTIPGTSGSASPDGGTAPAWPSTAVSSPFRGSVPPVPVLTAIRAAGHPEGGYDRISFEFSGQLPGYTAAYTDQVLADGSGAPVPLTGSAYLQLVFRSAQAHDANGVQTSGAVPGRMVAVGQAQLQAYVVDGDYEGTVSIALGLTTRGGFRVGVLTKSPTDHVIYVDVAR